MAWQAKGSEADSQFGARECAPTLGEHKRRVY